MGTFLIKISLRESVDGAGAATGPKKPGKKRSNQAMSPSWLSPLSLARQSRSCLYVCACGILQIFVKRRVLRTKQICDAF